MILGMPTLIELPTCEQNVKLCAELGLQFVELNMNLPEYADVGSLDRALLRALMRDYGVYFTLHLDERMDVCDFNPLVRRAYLETLRRALELAGELEIPILNLHLNPGVYFTLPEGKIYLYERERAHYLSCMEELRKAASAGGPKVCIENTEGFTFLQRQSIELLLESSAFGLTLDVGHLHAAGGEDEDFYQRHEDRLAHMHLHDAQGRRNHLPLGSGERDLTFAQRCGCRAVLEIKTVEALKQSVSALHRAKG